MWIALVIGFLVVLLVALLWRESQRRTRQARERAQRRSRSDQMVARVLLAEDRAERHTARGAPLVTQPAMPPSPHSPPAAIDILLGGEPTSVAEHARQQLSRPTTLISGLSGDATGPDGSHGAGASGLSLLDGPLDLPLDALVVAWCAARGYTTTRAPASAEPIRLLFSHQDDPDRRYAFYFERGRLQAQRAAALLEKAQEFGVRRLLVAAEHGAEPAATLGRLRDVVVVDWVVLDRELKRLDFRIAAKLLTIARTRRDVLGLD